MSDNDIEERKEETYLTERKKNDTDKLNTEHVFDKFAHSVWNDKFGKNVVLVSSDNPWYINTTTTVPMKIKNNTQNIDTEYTDYPISYAQTPKKNNDRVELFNDMSEKDLNVYNYIIIVLTIIILLQIMVLVRDKFKKYFSKNF